MARSNQTKKTLKRFFVTQNPVSVQGWEPEFRRLRSAIERAERSITTSIGQLTLTAAKQGIEIPKLRIEVHQDGDIVPSIHQLVKNAVLSFRQRPPNQLSALVYYDDLIDDLPADFVTDATGRVILGIRAYLPHETRPDDCNWQHSPGGLSSIGRVNANTLPSLLEDLIIDFAISNSSLCQLVTQSKPGNVIAAAKVAFALRRGAKCFHGQYGPTSDYVCFASCSRVSTHPGDIDFTRTLELWKNFVGELGKDTPMSATGDVLSYILTRHTQAGSISKTKLAEIIEALPSGAYHLIMTVNRPNAKSDRRRIASLLRKHIWHQFSWTIVPARDFPSLRREIEHGALSSFAFSK